MSKSFVLIKNFRTKVTVVLILFMCLSAAITNVIVYQYSLGAQLDQLREKLMLIAKATAMNIDPETLLQIPLTKDGVNSPAYKNIENKLLSVKEIVPNLAYAYILKRGKSMSMLKFIMDVHFGAYKSKERPAYPGEDYDARGYPELLTAFVAPSADTKLLADKWGTFLSGYAPIYDKRGDAMAIVGVDLSANDVAQIQKEVKKRALLILAFGIFFSAFLSLIISDTVTSPIKRLVAGTRHIASGDLQYQVKVENPDEIGELAVSFNNMSSNLYKAKKALLSYFYRAVQTLIRVLEAKDPYTRGHSDRVAEYSVKIAEKMGLPADKVEMLGEAALLHDIGKLGIQEMVLTKKAVLTDEDWRLIRKHPEIGEEILKPVSLDQELLAIVRGHHERYDGNGYPDRLSGENIDILTAIVAAADSYDAMTSKRAYKNTMTEAEAIEELKSNSGLQFNPNVVDAFVKVLKEKEG